MIVEEVFLTDPIKAMKQAALRELDYKTESKKGWGHVYIVGVFLDGFPVYKIGKASKITNRLGSLCVGLPLKLKIARLYLTDSPQALEALLHMRFEEKRVKGEWFKLTKEDITSINVERFIAMG